MRRKKIHVFTSDLLPFPGCARSAGGNRSMQIISALRQAGHDVTFSMSLTTYLSKKFRNVVIPQLSPEELWCCEHNHEPDVVLARIEPDIAIYCNVNALLKIGRYSRDIVQVLDFYGPVHLEGFLIDAADPEAAMRDGNLLEASTKDLLSRIRHVDKLISVSERQKYFWSAYCSLAGFSFEELDILICPVSFQIPAVTRNTAPNLKVVYSGGFYPWQNPDRFLRAAAEALDEIPNAEFHIFGGPHAGLPNEGQVNAMLAGLQKHRSVKYHGYRPVEEVAAALSSAWCALELMEQNIERELAITGRTVEFLSSGTPVIYNNYSTLSKLIEKYRAGWTLPVADTAVLRPVFEELVKGGPALVDDLSRNARKLAVEEFDTQKNSAALVKYCNGDVRKRGSLQRRSSASRVSGSPQRMGRVLGISPDNAALAELRMNNPLRALHRQGLIERFSRIGTSLEGLRHDTGFYEAIIIQRAVPPYLYRFLENLGVPFIMDIDDNLLARAAYRVSGAEWEAVDGLAKANVVTAPNPRLIRLLEKYSGLALGHKAFMTPNALPFQAGTRDPAPPSQIIWIQSDIAALTASREHIVRAVEDFSCRHKLPILLVGPNVMQRPKFTHQVVMGEIDFSSNLQLLEFAPTSIGVAPLETQSDQETLDFIAGKSDLKILLFDGYGHPGVYSASPPYTDSPLSSSARIIENTYDAWTAALEYQLREGWREVAANANKIRGGRHIDKIARETWLPALEAARFPRPMRGTEIYEAWSGFRNFNESPLSGIAYTIGNVDVQKNYLMQSDGKRGWNHYQEHGHAEHFRIALHDWKSHFEFLHSLEEASSEAANGSAAVSQQFNGGLSSNHNSHYAAIIEDLQKQIEDLRQSYSWKITAPIRALAKPVMERRS